MADPTPQSDAKKAAGAGGRFSLLGSVLGPFLALAVVVMIFGAADSLQEQGGGFLSSSNLRAISVQTAVVAVAALGMTIIIISGGVDLSAGTALALCATVLAWSLKEDVAMLIVHGSNVAATNAALDDALAEADRLNRRIEQYGTSEVFRLQKELEAVNEAIPQLRMDLNRLREASPRISPWSPIIGVVLTIAVGCLCGLVNGLLVSYLRIVPFIVTLGTMTAFLGVGKLVADETTVRPDRATQVPEWLNDFLSIRTTALWYGFPVGVWLTLLLAIILALVLRYTVFSRRVFALGSNEATARLCGIHVERNKIAVYVLAGLFVGIAGLYQFTRLSSGSPTSGIGMELKIIAAVVIGGGSLNGGRGTVLGTLTGATIMAVIDSGCTQLGLRNPIQDIIIGVIIVVAVAVDQIRQRRLEAR